jgi:hypothetical protein
MRISLLRAGSSIALLAAACSSPTSAPARDAPESGVPDAGRAFDSGIDREVDSSKAPAYPLLLSQAGLYEDLATETLAPGLRPHTPRYELWSDGAEKRRFIYLPPGARIDTSNMDYWQFPQGTKLFKEFSRDGVRVETRLLGKIGPEADDWVMVAYVFRPDGSDADARPEGVVDALGTPHNVPTAAECGWCHDRLAGRIAGFSAIQLDHEGPGLTLESLALEGALSDPPAGRYVVPGNATEQAALGYLHANCGQCHNSATRVTPMELWLEASSLDAVSSTPTYRTAVGARAQLFFPGTSATILVEPGNPEASMLYQRFVLGSMPGLVEIVDPTARELLKTWIASIAPSP